MSIQAGIYGASGYTGLALLDLLTHHPEIKVAFGVSDQFAGQSHSGVTFIPLEQADPSALGLVFLCTPHGASAPLAKQARAAGAKVVDLSADLRLKDAATYERWYHAPHPQADLLPVVYGLTEFAREQVIGQDLVANPGCYPTTTLVGLLPLAMAGGIAAGVPIVVDAKSGVSGAGRKPQLGTHFVEVFGDFKPYNIGRVHRHVGEMEQALHHYAAEELGPLVFSPHLLPIDRGLLATIYVTLAEGWTLDAVRDLYESRYADEPLITLLPDGATVRIADVARTNGAAISLHAGAGQTMIIVSATDNLLKGAASQALQNANLMCGYPETMGLL